MQNTKLYYPAIFHPEVDGGYSVSVPDMEQIHCACYTQGDTFEESFLMTEQAIDLALESVSQNDFPTPSLPTTLCVQNYERIVMVPHNL